MITWNEYEKARYQESTDELMLTGCRWLTILAFTLFPAFSFLDYFAHSQAIIELSLIRFSTTLISLVGLLFIWKLKKFKYSFLYASCLICLCATSITLMCLVLGGFKSPYYAGVNLVVLAAVLVLPVGAKRMSIVVSLVIGIYVFSVLLWLGLSPEELQALVNNLYFLVATGIIGLVSAYLAQRMRMESFDRFLQLEKTQIGVQRSRDLLQAELQSEQGNVETLIKEITERKIELEKAINLRDEFISLASHELNTPLTALKLQAQMAKRQISNDSQLAPGTVYKIIHTYDAQIERLIRIINDMLDISRISNGKFELELSMIDMVESVRRVVALFPGEPSISVTTSQASLVGKMDSFKIEQVILNLITNALKYGDQKPITISLFKENSNTVIEITDHGIGISPKDQARVFDRFERAVKPLEFSGLGLGLYITKQIVEAHKGLISVRSKKGSGSTFRIEFPDNS